MGNKTFNGKRLRERGRFAFLWIILFLHWPRRDIQISDIIIIIIILPRGVSAFRTFNRVSFLISKEKRDLFSFCSENNIIRRKRITDSQKIITLTSALFFSIYLRGGTY